VKLDGFTETGDPVLTLNVQDQKADSLVGSAGIEARGTLDIGGASVQPYVQAAVEREFAGDARTVRYALTAAPTIVNQWALPDRPDDIYGRITAGASLDITGAISLQVNATASIGQDLGNDVGGFFGLRVRM
jgi:outer membrane autotransporter protein